MKILLVEDDAFLGSSLERVLQTQTHVVDWVDRMETAQAGLCSSAYQLVLLDLGLPDGDGRDLIRWMRNRNDSTAVLVLSSRGEIRDRVAALDFGADDYLTKPFDLDELLARVRAAARRKPNFTGSLIRIGDLEIDQAGCLVWWKSNAVPLRPREFQLLVTLVEKRNRVVGRRELEELLSSWDETLESNVIEVLVHHLRRKLDPSVIETVRGLGYVIREG